MFRRGRYSCLFLEHFEIFVIFAPCGVFSAVLQSHAQVVRRCAGGAGEKSDEGEGGWEYVRGRDWKTEKTGSGGEVVT